MTKTTSYQISKKLAEIGFKANTDKCWAKIKNSRLSEFEIMPFDFRVPQNCEQWFLSFDLETILEALPYGLDQGNERYNLKMLPNISISYTNKFFNHIYDYRDDFCCENGEVMACISKNKETMVDMAGRLLIKLYENNLIKFEEGLTIIKYD